MPHRGGLVTALAVIGALLCCGAAQAKPVGFRHVATGTVFAGGVGPAARIVRDAPAFDALLAEWGIDQWQMQSARSRAAAVDFRRRSLIVLLDSQKPDTGYVDLVGEIDVVGRTATLTATTFTRRGIHLDAFANPWAMVSVPRAAVARVAPGLRVVTRCAARAHLCQLIESEAPG
jgi:hypothetical protein